MTSVSETSEESRQTLPDVEDKGWWRCCVLSVRSRTIAGLQAKVKACKCEKLGLSIEAATNNKYAHGPLPPR